VNANDVVGDQPTGTARVLQFDGNCGVRVERRPVPEPGPNELLVETTVSAVSPGTELLVYRGEVPQDMALDESIEPLSGGLEYPTAYGYAAAGRVRAVGEAVDDDWLGQRVFAFAPHRSHFTATPATVEPIPDGVGTEAATLLPTVETAVTLVQDAAPRLGERVAVFGAGLVGLATVAQLAAFPLDRLIVVDPLARRREAAHAMGADEAVTPAEVRATFDPPSPGAEGRDTSDAAVDVSVEISGNPDALDDALAVTGYAGRIVVGSWYGRRGRAVEVDLGGRFHRSRIDVRASQVSTIAPDLRGRWDGDRRLATAWDRLAALDTDRLHAREMPLERAPEAYRRLDAGELDSLGVVFAYDGSTTDG
jgi:threonine dehydrogenase-like Zn-dependent dehydrogenase